jgi:hypothetical protein
MTGDRVQRPAKPLGHMLDKAGFTASGWSLEQNRELLAPGSLEQLNLISDRLEKR